MNIKRSLAALAVTAGLVSVGLVTAGSASAHVAPPVGTSVCISSTVWSASGSATVSLAGTDKVKDKITVSAGTVVQTPLATVAESNGQVYTYTVSGIPVGTTSVKVTSTLTWGSVDKPQTDVKTVTISEPKDGCVVTITSSTPPPSTTTPPPATSSTPPASTTTVPPATTTTPPPTAKLTPALATTGADSGAPLTIGIIALVVGLLSLGGAFGYRRLAGKRH